MKLFTKISSAESEFKLKASASNQTEQKEKQTHQPTNENNWMVGK